MTQGGSSTEPAFPAGAPGDLSPDGRWQWDGHEWIPTYPREEPAPYPGSAGWVPPPAEQLDLASAPDDNLPDRVDELDEGATVTTLWIAVGPGWLAVRRMHWHPIPTSVVTRLAIAPPRTGTGPETQTDHSWQAPSPLLVVEDRKGHVLTVDLRRISEPILQAIASQIPPTAVVAPAAAQYLSTGRLPGDWDTPYHFLAMPNP